MKTLKISVLILILFIIITQVIQVYFLNIVKYNEKQYKIKDDEYGIMLFDEYNAGDYHVGRVFQNEREYYLNIWDYQNKNKKWVKLVDDNIYDIDSIEFNFSNFNEVETNEILEKIFW